MDLATMREYRNYIEKAWRAGMPWQPPIVERAMRWALQLADERIAEEADEADPAFQTAILRSLAEPPTRTLPPSQGRTD